MALVRVIEAVSKERHGVHGEVVCHSSMFSDERGRRYLQLDTYGSPGRSLPGKVSQSLQFDEAGARRLVELLEEAFPTLLEG